MRAFQSPCFLAFIYVFVPARMAGTAFGANGFCIQRSGMAKLPNKIVPECHERVDCARLSAAKEWTQAACEWTRWLYRKKPWQFGRGAVFPPRTAIPLLYAGIQPCL